jgi:hypothetical protein
VLAAIPENSGRAADLGRALNLDSATAWRIHALASQTGGLSAQSVPRPGSMERFLAAAARVAPADAARSVRSAYEAFEQMVDAHAGDRDTFDAMMALQRPDDSTALRRVRRTAYRGNAAAWGVTSRAMLRAAIFHERPTGEIDSLSILGHLGVQRLHPDALVTLLASPLIWDDGPLRPESFERATKGRLQLIESACSRPLPRIERAATSDGSHRDVLVMDGLGKQSETTVYVRSLLTAVPGADPLPPYSNTTTCRLPIELMITDLLIPRSWGSAQRGIRTWISPDLGPGATDEATQKYRLPFEGACIHLGTSLNSLYSAASPRHAEIIQSEIATMGWEGTEFDVFRCEVQYPLLHSAVHIHIE